MARLWEKILFWKKPKMLEQDVDYTFVDFDNSEITGIALLMEKYNGVIYHYHKARIVEEGEMARLQFGYTIVHPGKHEPDVLNSDEEFHTIMGDILTIILMKKAEDEQTRTDYIEEPYP